MVTPMSAFKPAMVASVLCLSAALAGTADAALFIAAHPDDIEYLMNRNAQIDVKSKYPTVLVLTTAGDAFSGTQPAGNTKNMPYYRARLNAHERAVRFWQGLDPDVPAPLPAYSTEVIEGKRIETVTMGNVVLYNLNLPDNGTLLQLSHGEIPSVISISPVNTYTLKQLKDVIRAIIRINNPDTPMINVNTQEPDPAWSPDDHPDHRATGEIVLAALAEVREFHCVNQIFYKGYSVGGYAPTYSPDELDIHVATIGALNAGLIDNGNKSTWDAFHNQFFGKIDYRVIMGSEDCAFSAPPPSPVPAEPVFQ
jgi:LmbE family N-acetylglucosaminyl deacetylase